MVKVLGIGGVFFRSMDPNRLSEWYHKHLGIDPVPTDTEAKPWMTETGVTVFAPFAQDTSYFPEDKSFMLNFRVENLAAALEELKAAGVPSGDIEHIDGIGHFARIHDPEGNPIELWEPT